MTPQTESSQRPETISAPVHQLASELQILRTELEIQNGKLREAERRERELTEHLREARQLDSLGRLAGGVAHDFNNLLQIISESLDLLADDSRAEDRADSLRSARSAIDRATLLTRQIMVYSQRTPSSTSAPEWDDPDGAVILVAEDDPVIRRILERFLRHRGFEVILATDGAEAVDRFNAHAAAGIDLLMFDIEMPKLSGTDAYNVIRHHPACPPVLFVSGVAEEAAAPSSRRIRFLRKPYSEPDLLATLAALREEAMR